MQVSQPNKEGREGEEGKKRLNAHDAYTLLVGEVGISRQEFLYELRLWEINAIVEGYRNRAHTAWEVARWQTFCIVCAMGAKNISTPEDIQRFPWETETVQAEEMSEEDRDELLREMEEENERLAKLRNEEDQPDNNPLQ